MEKRKKALYIAAHLWTLALRRLKKVSFWAVCLCSVSLLLVWSQVVTPSRENNRFGIVTGKSLAGKTLYEKMAADESAPYVPVLYDDAKTLEEDVLTGKADCGFVFDDALDEALQQGKLRHCATYIASPDTMRGPVIREKMYSILYETLMRRTLTELSGDGTVFAERDEALQQEVLAWYDTYLAGNDTMQIKFEDAGSGTDKSALADKARESDWKEGWYLLIFAISLIFAAGRFDRSDKNYLAARRPGYRLWYEWYGCAVPTIAAGLLLCLGAALGLPLAGGAGIGAADIFTMLLYCLVCSIWSAAFALLWGRHTIGYSFAAVGVWCFGLITGLETLRMTTLAPALRLAGKLFPTGWF